MTTFETSPTKEEIGLDNVENILNNYSATSNPAITDDNTAGYQIGSRWINTATDEEFVCLNDSTGAAVWATTTSDGPSGDSARVVIRVQKGSVGTINPGQVIYLSGYDLGANVIEVELADATSSATMPAIAVASTAITQTVSGTAVVLGNLTNQVTTGYSVGDPLYVDTTPGAIINSRPTGTALVQKVGIVARTHPSQGIIEVIGAGRVNDVPNLTADHIWIGNSIGVPIEAPLEEAVGEAYPASGAAQAVFLDYVPFLGAWSYMNKRDHKGFKDDILYGRVFLQAGDYDGVRVYINKGDPGREIEIGVYGDDGGDPAEPSGSLLHTTGAIDLLGTTEEWKLFSLTTTLTVPTGGAYYWIAITTSDDGVELGGSNHAFPGGYVDHFFKFSTGAGRPLGTLPTFDAAADSNVVFFAVKKA